jgi:hypothetical protein
MYRCCRSAALLSGMINFSVYVVETFRSARRRANLLGDACFESIGSKSERTRRGTPFPAGKNLGGPDSALMRPAQQEERSLHGTAPYVICYNEIRQVFPFPGSSTVEHSAVNRRVASSNLARVAKLLQNFQTVASDSIFLEFGAHAAACLLNFSLDSFSSARGYDDPFKCHRAPFLDSCEERAYNHPFVIAAIG